MLVLVGQSQCACAEELASLSIEVGAGYCRGIELNPTGSGAHGALGGLLRRKERTGGLRWPLERLLERLEKLVADGADDTSLILKTLALAFI